MDERNGSAKAVSILLGIVIGGAVAVPIALAGYSSSNPETGKVDRQAVAWTRADASTSSSEFTDIPDLGGVVTTNKGPVTASFSGDLAGAPVEVRVLQDKEVFKPGAAHFRPGSDPSSFAYTFVGRGKSLEGCHTYSVQWRSPSGDSVTLSRGDLVLSFNFDKKRKGQTLTCG